MSGWDTSLYEALLEDAASALNSITPYSMDQTRAIIRAIAEYRPVEEVATLLEYAGVPLGEPQRLIIVARIEKADPHEDDE